MEARPRRQHQAFSILALAALLGLAGTAAAQAPPVPQPEQPEVEQRRVREAAGEMEEARRAAGEAEILRPLQEGEEVTYQQVLQDPDNLELSYLYAQTLVKRGELRGAAAALERILLIRPDLPRARLFYAIVLFRLDSIREAEREFLVVQKYDLPPRLREEVERYLEAIADRKKITRYGASFSFGMQFDTNRNSSPRSGKREVFGISGFDVVDEDEEADDFGIFGLVELSAEHDLGLEAGHKLLGSASYYVSDQDHEDQLDLMAWSVEGGGLYRTDWADFTPMVYASLITLSSEQFFRNVGFRVRADRRLKPRIDVFGHALFEWQDFDATRQSITSKERTGMYGELMLGGAVQLTPAHRLSAEFTLADKSARGSSFDDRTHRVFGYFGQELQLRHTWLLGRGQFLLTTASVGRDSYDRADFRVTTQRTRRDLRTRASVIYGAPLEFLIPGVELPEPLRTLLVSVSAEYYRVSSNITNYTFDNAKATLLFTKSFSF